MAPANLWNNILQDALCKYSKALGLRGLADGLCDENEEIPEVADVVPLPVIPRPTGSLKQAPNNPSSAAVVWPIVQPSQINPAPGVTAPQLPSVSVSQMPQQTQGYPEPGTIAGQVTTVKAYPRATAPRKVDVSLPGNGEAAFARARAFAG